MRWSQAARMHSCQDKWRSTMPKTMRPAAWCLAAAARSTSRSRSGPGYERKPRAWIWAGDAIYGDRMVRAVPLTFEALGPEHLRDAYRTQNAIPEYAELRKEVPYWIATWDDHDFGLNDGGGDLPWRDASQAVFLEAMDLTVESGQHGVYTRTTVPVEGGSVLVVALDLRYHKSPYSDKRETSSARPSGPGSRRRYNVQRRTPLWSCRRCRSWTSAMGWASAGAASPPREADY